MQGNVRRDTKPELRLRRTLHGVGLRYVVDSAPVPELRWRADLVFRGPRVAVFVDGCFWHGCPEHGTRPATNATYWQAKIGRNRKRDQEQTSALTAAGWLVIRVWEHEPTGDAAARIEAVVRDRGPGLARSQA
jgi:DNA mismatch endonuclease, patch repair protein